MASAFFANTAPMSGAAPSAASSGRSPHQASSFTSQQQQQQGTPPVPQRSTPAPSASRGLAAGQHALASPQAVPWRPPATRRFLWDRTPQGPAIALDLGNTQLQLAVEASTWRLLQRLHQGASGTVSLTARLCAPAASGAPLQVEIGAGAPDAADVAVPVVVTSSSSGGGSGTSPSKLQAHASQLSAAYEVACSRQQGAGLAQLMQASCTSSCAPDGSVALRGLLAVPAPVLTFKPILAKSVSLQPLAKALQGTLRPGAAPAPFQDGLLSMDQGRSLVPLAADDPLAYSVPLMGVWAAGADSVRHPLVAAACIKFLCSRALADKAVEADRSFLLLLYAQGPGRGVAPVCYECHVGLGGGSVVPLKALAISASAADGGGKGASPCALAPAPDVQLAGCPGSVGRALGTQQQQQQQQLSPQPSQQPQQQQLRLTATVQPREKCAIWLSRNSPGSAGSGVSNSSVHIPNRSALRTGESPTILPPCGAAAAPAAHLHSHPQPPPVWQRWGSECPEAAVRLPAGEQAPLRTAAVAAAAHEAAPGPGASPAALSAHGSSHSVGVLPPSQLPPVEAEPGNASFHHPWQPGGPPAQVAASTHHPPGGLLNPEQQGEPEEEQREQQQDQGGGGAACGGGIGSDTQAGGAGEVAAVPGQASNSQSSSGTAVASPAVSEPLKERSGQPPMQEASGACLAPEHTECFCLGEDLSGSMPSLAGWSSTAVQPAQQASTATSWPAGDTQGSKQPAQLQPPESGPEQKAIGSKQGPPQPATSLCPIPTEKAAAVLQATPPIAGVPASNACQAMFVTGGGMPWWVPQLAPEAGLSREVAVLQQEVIMLRQQVQVLQYQLQAMQVVPLMMQPPPYLALSEAWGPAMAGAQWPPMQPVFAPSAAAAPVASVQYSSSATPHILGTPASQPLPSATEAPLQSSPAAGSVESAGAAALQAAQPSPASEGVLIPAFREAAGSASPPLPSSEGGRQPPGNAAQPSKAVSLVQQGEPALVPEAGQVETGPSPGLAAGDLQRGSTGQEVAAPAWRMDKEGLVGRAPLGPPSVADVEADIDRLIEDAERAVSVLSCRSDGGWVDDDGICASVVEAPAAAASYHDPSGSLGSGGSAHSGGSVRRDGSACSSGGGKLAGTTAAAVAAAAAPPAAFHSSSKGQQPSPAAPLSVSVASRRSTCSSGTLGGVVRVKVPRFLDLDVGSAGESDDEEEVERLEQKYGLVSSRTRRELSAGHSDSFLDANNSPRSSRRLGTKGF